MHRRHLAYTLYNYLVQHDTSLRTIKRLVAAKIWVDFS